MSKDTFSEIVIRPFYHTHFMKKVMGRLFSQLSYRYSAIEWNKSRVISEQEFRQKEEKIAIALAGETR